MISRLLAVTSKAGNSLYVTYLLRTPVPLRIWAISALKLSPVVRCLISRKGFSCCQVPTGPENTSCWSLPVRVLLLLLAGPAASWGSWFCFSVLLFDLSFLQGPKEIQLPPWMLPWLPESSLEMSHFHMELMVSRRQFNLCSRTISFHDICHSLYLCEFNLPNSFAWFLGAGTMMQVYSILCNSSPVESIFGAYWMLV